MADTTANYGFHYPLQKDNPLEARRYLDEIDSTLYGITGGVGPVDSFNGRTGIVVPATNDYTWAQIDKTTSSLADLATRSASDLSSGTLAVARGGTGTGSFTANGVLYGNGTSAIGVTAAPSTDYKVLGVQSGIPVFTDQPNVQIMQIGVGSSTTGDLRLANSTNTNLLHVQSGINTGAWTMTMPTSAGTVDYVLRTDGGGIMSWISGQSIAGLKTTSSPEFSDLTLSGSNPTNGFLKVGTYNIISGAIGINVAGVTTAHNQAYGAYIEGSDLSWSGVGPNTTVTTAVTGIYSLTRTHLNSAPITILYAIEGDAIVHNATSLDRGYGVYALVDVNTSTITQRVVGVRSNVTLANTNTIPLAIGFKGTQTISTGTITDVRGLDLSEWSASSTVTTSYGIYIDSSIDIGTTKYALYSTSLSNSLLQGGLSLGVAGTTLGLLKMSGNTSGTITINTAAAAGTWTFTLPTGAGTNGYVLSTNGSGVTSWIAQSGGGGTVTSIATTSPISGGTITGSGTISLLVNVDFAFTASQSIKVSDAATNAFTDLETLGHNSSGTVAANFGGSILFNLQSSTTADQNAGRIGSIWTIATHASRTSAVVIQTVNSAAALTEVARFAGNGDFTLTGVIKVGSSPTTLTDSAGKILSAALNTVAVTQGGTGLASFTASYIPYATATNTLGTSVNFQFNGNHLAIGGTTYSWDASSAPAVVYGPTEGFAFGSATDFHLVSNAYLYSGGGGAWKYMTTQLAVNAYMYQGEYVVRTAPSGTAGNAVTWTERFKIGNTGILTTNGTAGVSAGSFSAITAITSTNGLVTQLTGTSDERLKQDIRPFEYGLSALRDIKPIYYRWNAISKFDNGSEWIGFSAQNVQRAIPDAVGKEVWSDGSEWLTINRPALLGAAINAINELEARVKELETQLRSRQ